MINFADKDIKDNGEYLNLLSIMASLSRLFSESETPFIYYRFAENVFCKCFNAHNLSRSDTAFDAKIDTLGIGLKTFTFTSNSSLEKVAEFNALSREFDDLNPDELAFKLSNFRNDRINLAKRTYEIDNALYHIVARTNGKLVFFETDYDEIDISNLQDIKSTKSGIKFSDGINEYSFNRSKSTLLRNFSIPDNAYKKDIEIIDDVYSLLSKLGRINLTPPKKAGIDYIVLPLYSIKNGRKIIFERSSLNQWNAGGRVRDINEMYINYPAKAREINENFFPPRDQEFILQTPTGENLRAKICQDNNKALMTNPNKAISDWLLRKVLKLDEGELATYERLEILGFDSVIVYKHDNLYSIDIMPLGSYEKFINLFYKTS